MKDDIDDKRTSQDDSDQIGSESVGQETTENSSNPENSASEKGSSAPQDQWFERLNNYQEELESTTDPERRQELIEIIEEVEDGLVEKGLLEESERGDYRIQPDPSQGDATQAGEAETDQSLASSKGNNSESTKSSDNRRSEPESRSQTRDDQKEREDRDPDHTPTRKSDSHEDTKKSENSGEETLGAETGQKPSDEENHITNTEEADNHGPSIDAETDPESTSPTGEQSESKSSDTVEQTKSGSEVLNEGSPDGNDTEREATSEAAMDADSSDDDTVNPYLNSEGIDGTETEDADTISVSNDSDEIEEETEETTDDSPETDTDQSPDVEALVARVEELENHFEEFKRSNNHEHQEIRKYSVEGFAENMLRVRDTLERAVELFDWDEEKRGRMEAVISQFDQQYTAGEISTIEPEIGTKFDYNRHEVVDREETADREKNEIIRIDRKGFELGNRVIRPAQVTVTA